MGHNLNTAHKIWFNPSQEWLCVWYASYIQSNLRDRQICHTIKYCLTETMPHVNNMSQDTCTYKENHVNLNNCNRIILKASQPFQKLGIWQFAENGRWKNNIYWKKYSIDKKLLFTKICLSHAWLEKRHVLSSRVMCGPLCIGGAC